MPAHYLFFSFDNALHKLDTRIDFTELPGSIPGRRDRITAFSLAKDLKMQERHKDVGKASLLTDERYCMDMASTSKICLQDKTFS
jgi:hypothetical protein